MSFTAISNPVFPLRLLMLKVYLLLAYVGAVDVFHTVEPSSPFSPALPTTCPKLKSWPPSAIIMYLLFVDLYYK